MMLGFENNWRFRVNKNSINEIYILIFLPIVAITLGSDWDIKIY